MFQNVYHRERDGRRVFAGRWPTREAADSRAALNERDGFRRIDCIETADCPSCEGYGTVSYYVGSYGTYGCSGPAEKPCDDCGGTGQA